MFHQNDRTNENPSVFFPFSKRFSTVFCTVFAVFLVVTPALLFFLPQKTFSEDENRMLTTAPTLSSEGLFAGEYTDQLSSYLRDHFPARNTLLKAKSFSEYTLMRNENNGVVLAADGYLIKRFSYTDSQLVTFRENVGRIVTLKSALAEHQKPAVFMCAPRAIDVLADRCHGAASEPSERSVWKILTTEDPSALCPTAMLTEKALRGEKVWFRTDHHWTVLGAYYAYCALGDTLGYTPLPREAFYESTVSTTFLGTSYSAALFPFVRPDSITAMRYADDGDFLCTDVQTDRTQKGFYREEALLQKDQYAYFLGANTAHVRIVRDPETPRPTLLVIKDSYAQSMVPFLARHFDIELLDLRYFRGDATETVSTVINGAHYAGTLILCNADTLTGDAGLARIAPDKL